MNKVFIAGAILVSSLILSGCSADNDTSYSEYPKEYQVRDNGRTLIEPNGTEWESLDEWPDDMDPRDIPSTVHEDPLTGKLY